MTNARVVLFTAFAARSHLVFLITIIMLVGCQSNSASGQSTTLRFDQRRTVARDVPLEFLLNAAATDFHKEHVSHTMHFRNVRIGHLVNSEGEKVYVLCGQFLPATTKGKADWVAFGTIKTSGYEQWVGAQSAHYCERPSLEWADGDFSYSLQSHFDSLQ